MQLNYNFKILCDVNEETEKVEGIIVSGGFGKDYVTKVDFKTSLSSIGTCLAMYLTSGMLPDVFSEKLKLEEIKEYEYVISLSVESNIKTDFSIDINSDDLPCYSNQYEIEYVMLSSKYLTMCANIVSVFDNTKALLSDDEDKVEHVPDVYPNDKTRLSRFISEYFSHNIQYKKRSRRTFIVNSTTDYYQCIYNLPEKSNGIIGPRGRCKFILTTQLRNKSLQTGVYNCAINAFSTMVPKKINNSNGTEFIYTNSPLEFYFPYFNIMIKEGGGYNYIVSENTASRSDTEAFVYENLSNRKAAYIHSNLIILRDDGPKKCGDKSVEVLVSYPEVRSKSLALKYAIDTLLAAEYRL